MKRRALPSLAAALRLLPPRTACAAPALALTTLVRQCVSGCKCKVDRSSIHTPLARIYTYIGLWIFTRTQARDVGLIERARAIAREKGFDTDVLQDVNHVGCTYTPGNNRGGFLRFLRG